MKRAHDDHPLVKSALTLLMASIIWLLVVLAAAGGTT